MMIYAIGFSLMNGTPDSEFGLFADLDVAKDAARELHGGEGELEWWHVAEHTWVLQAWEGGDGIARHTRNTGWHVDGSRVLGSVEEARAYWATWPHHPAAQVAELTELASFGL